MDAYQHRRPRTERCRQMARRRYAVQSLSVSESRWECSPRSLSLLENTVRYVQHFSTSRSKFTCRNMLAIERRISISTHAQLVVKYRSTALQRERGAHRFTQGISHISSKIEIRMIRQIDRCCFRRGRTKIHQQAFVHCQGIRHCDIHFTGEPIFTFNSRMTCTQSSLSHRSILTVWTRIGKYNRIIVRCRTLPRALMKDAVEMMLSRIVLLQLMHHSVQLEARISYPIGHTTDGTPEKIRIVHVACR